MKKFNKIDEKKFEKLLADAPKNSLLKAVLGGGPSCSKQVAYADTTYVNNIYQNWPYANFNG